ncbi:competence protein ComK [Pseudobacillus wudalianchiensis]|uniref:Competence protein n=1 Tax=Pseudobacillus wudalianchiensis TaxID=1743143 RepID=A0A1B9AY54_9BACI|nr:competence protein ComK [Bacillus wudalianchiensis]OCA88905.1 hypothetical protein A8F95_05625 [Bacillus wudalianchiensis]
MIILEDYNVSLNTMALTEKHHPDYNTIIYDRKGIYYSKKTVKKILEEACLQRFCTYDGRIKSMRKRTRYFKKTPLLICPDEDIYAFPTMSPAKHGCGWFFANLVRTFKMKKGQLIVTFVNGLQLPVDCSLKVFKQQLERTATCMNYYRNDKMSM